MNIEQHNQSSPLWERLNACFYHLSLRFFFIYGGEFIQWNVLFMQLKRVSMGRSFRLLVIFLFRRLITIKINEAVKLLKFNCYKKMLLISNTCIKEFNPFFDISRNKCIAFLIYINLYLEIFFNEIHLSV